MRWPLLVILLPLASCQTLSTVPAPWEPTESQLAEPSQPSSAAAPAWTKIGSSVRGKPIEAVTLGTGGRRIYVLGGIDGDEPEGPAAAADLPAALLPDFVSAADRATVRIVRDMNPDGTASGTRGNTRGIDLNRNWPSRDYLAETAPGSKAGRRAASELEITTIQADLTAFKPDVVIVFHSASTGRGPEVSFVGRSLTYAYDFSSAARQADPHWRVNPDQRHIIPGSIESLVGRDMGKPVLNVEFKRGSSPATNVKSARAGIAALMANSQAKAAPPPATPPAAPIKAPILGGGH